MFSSPSQAVNAQITAALLKNPSVQDVMSFSGLDALTQMRAAGYEGPAILLTAISDVSFREMEGAHAIQVRLDKPVTRRSLERALERALDQALGA